MKNSFYNKLKNGLNDTKYNFSKNLLFHIIAPCLIILVGLILLLCVNFNVSYDFKGGTVATVVVETDLNNKENYDLVKKDIDAVCKDNKIEVIVYQKADVNNYGDAISIKFDRVSDEVREQLKQDLLEKFHPDITDEFEKDIFVKVDNFDRNVSTEVTMSLILAILVTFVALFVYIASRKGICAGFISLFASVISNFTFAGLLLITRTVIDINVVGAFAFVTLLSELLSMLFITKANENFGKEIHAKTTKMDLANITIKDNFKLIAVISIIVLMFALFMVVMPLYAVQNIGIAMFIGLVSCVYTDIMILPGLWAILFIPRKKKQKAVNNNNNVIVEEKLTEDDINNAPEVIVETEAKE